MWRQEAASAHHQWVLLCDDAQTHRCHRQVWFRSWNLGELSSFRLHLVTKCWRWNKVQRLPACFPAAPGQSLVCLAFPHSPGTVCGSGQVTEFVAPWFDTVCQILLVLSAGCSVPVVCEHWQNSLQEREET